MKPRETMETCLYVEDLEEAERFYSGALGLEKIASEEGRHVFFRCGRGVLLIFNPLKTIEPDDPGEGLEIPMHGAQGPGHAAFAATEEELSAWRDYLEAKNIPIERSLTWPGGGRSIYFRDPAGNSLEFVTPKTWGFEDDEVL